MTPKNKLDKGYISWQDNFFINQNYLCGNISYNWKECIFKFQKMSYQTQDVYIKHFWIRIYLIVKTKLKIFIKT